MKRRTPHLIALVLLACCLLPTFALAAAPSEAGERPDLARLFDEQGVVGCFVAQTDTGLVRVNPGRAAQGFRPASTYKILNSLVALETGVAHDTGKVLLWDGVRREVPAWNSDLSMNEAFRASAVWYFVEIARQNGREALGKAMREVGYGNADATGSEQFWIDGPLRISAEEQVRFLARLTRGEVPFAARHRVLVARMMLLEEGRDASGAAWALYGKTGLAPLSGGVAEASADTAVGWLVGWVERGGQKYPYALNISPKDAGTPAGPEFARARPLLVKALLRELGLLPAK